MKFSPRDEFDMKAVRAAALIKSQLARNTLALIAASAFLPKLRRRPDEMSCSAGSFDHEAYKLIFFAFRVVALTSLAAAAPKAPIL
jgi:hypothetical protein